MRFGSNTFAVPQQHPTPLTAALNSAACFHLFDKSPHAFDKVHRWSDRQGEFQKRAAFALLASIALHNKKADGERNFVKKGVSWALRGIGIRRSPELQRAARTLAEQLATSTDPTTPRIGKDALRESTKKQSKR